MNYYEHHLGDYAKKTLHLSMLEDGAYRRLIDVYYTRELPLPIDSRELYRLVRAQNKADRASVDAVLLEFFQKKSDGWHHNRCDEEISRYAESQVGNEEKKEHDKERQRRARERRKTLFATLREHDLVPPWDTKTQDLEAMLSRVTSRDESQGGHGDGHAPVTPPVTRDNTATHGDLSHPQSQSQSPDPVKKTNNRGVRFDDFWAAWPAGERKQDRKQCCEKWKSKGLDEFADAILADIAVKRNTEKWREGYIEAPLVYINNRRWEDGATTGQPKQESFV